MRRMVLRMDSSFIEYMCSVVFFRLMRRIFHHGSGLGPLPPTVSLVVMLDIPFP